MTELDEHRWAEHPQAIPKDTRADVLERDDHQCQVCGTHRDLQLHHWLHFRSRGGGHDAWNLVTVCWRCHEQIHAHEIDIVLHQVRGVWRAFVTRKRI